MRRVAGSCCGLPSAKFRGELSHGRHFGGMLRCLSRYCVHACPVGRKGIGKIYIGRGCAAEVFLKNPNFQATLEPILVPTTMFDPLFDHYQENITLGFMFMSGEDCFEPTQKAQFIRKKLRILRQSLPWTGQAVVVPGGGPK